MKKVLKIGLSLFLLVSCQSHNADYYFNKGVAFFDNKQYAEALEMYNKAITIDSTNSVYFVNRGSSKDNMNDPQGAYSDYKKAYELDSTNLLANLYIAITFFDNGNNKQAILFYDRASRYHPDYYSTYYGCGIAKYEVGDYEGALEQFAKYLGYDPNNHWVYYYAGMCNKNMGRIEYAKEFLEEAKNLGSKKAMDELGKFRKIETINQGF